METNALSNDYKNEIEYIKFLERIIGIKFDKYKVEIWRTLYEILSKVDIVIEYKLIQEFGKTQKDINPLLVVYKIILEESKRRLTEIFENNLDIIIITKGCGNWNELKNKLRKEFDTYLFIILIQQTKNKIYYERVNGFKDFLKQLNLDQEIKEHNDKTLNWFLQEIDYRMGV
jgi:hypothetical protein